MKMRRTAALALALMCALTACTPKGQQEPGKPEAPAVTEPEKLPELTAPDISDIVIEYLPEAAELTASWPAVEGAEGYEVKHARKLSHEDEWEPEELTETAELSYTEGYQDYYDVRWSVRAYRGEGSSREYGPWSRTVEGSSYEPDILTYERLSKYRFIFESGAGAWGTELTFEGDEYGSFMGAWHDSNMGEIGEGYPNGSFYYCDFKGNLGPLERVDDHTWKARLEALGYEREPGIEEIGDDGMRYVTGEAYGIAGAEEVYFYLPGKPVSELPEGFKEWTHFALANYDDGHLHFLGMYNEAMEQGFEGILEEYDRADIVTLFLDTEERGARLDERLSAGDLDQSSMNMLSYEDYYMWDEVLNRIWDYLRENMEESEFKTLTEEQKVWIAEKEAAVKEAGREVEGGSMQPLVENGEAASRTEERVRELMDRYFSVG